MRQESSILQRQKGLAYNQKNKWDNPNSLFLCMILEIFHKLEQKFLGVNKKMKHFFQKKEKKKKKRWIPILVFHPTKRKVCTLLACCFVFGALAIGAKPAANQVSLLLESSAERKLPIYCVQTDEKKIAISFDAAWGADDTDQLLQILADNDVHATFFLCGYWVEKYPEEVQKIAAAGHDLGNHSATHPHMSQISAEEITKELQECHQAVKELTGIDMELFRPPFGEYDNHVIETATANGYFSIQWDVDSLDWMEKGADAEIHQVLENSHLGNGSIILFHNDAKYTPEVLDTIIKGLKEKGYTLVPISELIYRGEYTMDHEGRQIPQQTQTTQKDTKSASVQICG